VKSLQSKYHKCKQFISTEDKYFGVSYIFLKSYW